MRTDFRHEPKGAASLPHAGKFDPPRWAEAQRGCAPLLLEYLAPTLIVVAMAAFAIVVWKIIDNALILEGVCKGSLSRSGEHGKETIVRGRRFGSPMVHKQLVGSPRLQVQYRDLPVKRYVGQRALTTGVQRGLARTWHEARQQTDG